LLGTTRSPPIPKVDLLRAQIEKATKWKRMKKFKTEREYVESVLADVKCLLVPILPFEAPKLMCLPVQTRLRLRFSPTTPLLLVPSRCVSKLIDRTRLFETLKLLRARS